MKKKIAVVVGAAGTLVAGVFFAPNATAAAGWVAAANSPGHEQLGYGHGPDKATADGMALSNCAQRPEKPSDCRILASGPDCVAVAWDGAEPINQAHGASGGGRDVVIQGAKDKAGPHANDVSARCVWDYS